MLFKGEIDPSAMKKLKKYSFVFTYIEFVLLFEVVLESAPQLFDVLIFHCFAVVIATIIQNRDEADFDAYYVF